MNTAQSKQRLCYLLSALVGLLGLCVIFLRPLDPLLYQWADDALYFNNAQAILNHLGSAQWLGPFNEIVLSKAPLFPVFLAFIHTINLPLRVAEFCLFALLPILATRAFNPLRLYQPLVFLIASVTFILIPIVCNDIRLLRTALFGFTLLLFLIFLIGFLIRVLVASHWPSHRWAAGMGLALGLASTTREEASWLMAPLLVALFFVSWQSLATKHIKNLAMVLVVIAVAYQIPVSFVSFLNYNGYGIYSPSLRQNSSFHELYATLASLEPSRHVQYVPIPTDVRKKAYSVSPHFRELEPYLDGEPLDSLATNQGHLSLNNWDLQGREFFVSNFEFALAKSIVMSGRTSGEEFTIYCDTVVSELDSAIESGLLEAGWGGLSMLPPFTRREIWPIANSTMTSLGFLLKVNGLAYRNNFSSGQSENKWVWHSFLRTWPAFDTSFVGKGVYTIPPTYHFLVGFYQAVSIPLLVSGFLSLAIFFRRKKIKELKVCSAMLAVSWAGIIGFSLAMGVADVVAFPILRWPAGYNSMGFYMLHFLLFSSAVLVASVFNRGLHKFK